MRATRLRLVSCLAVLASSAAWAAPDPTPLSNAVVVLAAASLRGAFEAIAAELERAQPALDVQLSFAGTPTLVQQIRDGARADVFASADEANMEKVATAGELAAPPRIFAGNRLAIVVPKGNPTGVKSLADLTTPGVTVALCAPAVPAGRYAVEAFRRAGLTPPAASQEADVKAVVGKAALGEIDAGIVYVTDVMAAAPAVEGIDIPAEHNVAARYPIAVLKAAANRAGAQVLVDYVLSPNGQATLSRFGFTGAPSPS